MAFKFKLPSLKLPGDTSAPEETSQSTIMDNLQQAAVRGARFNPPGLGAKPIGIQPPNQWALNITIGFLVLTAIVWFALEKRRFQGPPIGDVIKKRQAAIQAPSSACPRGPASGRPRSQR